jgi:hypothetical protein
MASPPFMGPEVSLFCSKEFHLIQRLEPHEFNSDHHFVFLS